MHPRDIPATGQAFRALSNLVAFLALLLVADWAIAWWRGTPTYACTGSIGLMSDSGLTLLGMFGLLLAILGVALGGARHWMTGIGIVVLVFGLLGLTLLADPIARLCS